MITFRLRSMLPSVRERARTGFACATVRPGCEFENTGSAGSCLDCARRFPTHHARACLADHRVSIPEGAFLLGFSDQTSVNRAFRRWAGLSRGIGRRHSTGRLPAGTWTTQPEGRPHLHRHRPQQLLWRWAERSAVIAFPNRPAQVGPLWPPGPCAPGGNYAHLAGTPLMLWRGRGALLLHRIPARSRRTR
jgi:hypothetical protein